jgi:hemerythrin-like domain-containing protein
MAVPRQRIVPVTRQPEAITTLHNEHRYMALLLDTLEERMKGEGPIPAADYFLIHDIVHYMHAYPDAVHHPTEDLMFAKLVSRDPSTTAAVGALQRDHEKLTGSTDKILRLLRTAEFEQSVAAADAVRNSCTGYIGRLREHIEKEELELFPKAIASLTVNDWKAIDTRLQAMDDPLFGRTVDSRFRPLFEYFSGPAGKVSRRLTRFSFLQFDSIIESAEALEKGAGELLVQLGNHAKAIVDESGKVWQRTRDGRSVGSVIATQLGFVRFLGSKAVDVGTATAGIYFKTAAQMLAPFFNRK